jgi:hypothetical protein
MRLRQGDTDRGARTINLRQMTMHSGAGRCIPFQMVAGGATSFIASTSFRFKQLRLLRPHQGRLDM